MIFSHHQTRQNSQNSADFSKIRNSLFATLTRDFPWLINSESRVTINFRTFCLSWLKSPEFVHLSLFPSNSPTVKHCWDLVFAALAWVAPQETFSLFFWCLMFYVTAPHSPHGVHISGLRNAHEQCQIKSSSQFLHSLWWNICAFP